MNRDIKFRAWDQVNRKMILPPEEYSSSAGYYFFTLDGRCYVNGKYQEFILLQCTGLKDKNGKEIFEGDILHSHNSSWVVRYVGGCYIADGPSLGNINTLSHVLWFRKRAGIPLEIIGNIYEHKELLNETE